MKLFCLPLEPLIVLYVTLLQYAIVQCLKDTRFCWQKYIISSMQFKNKYVILYMCIKIGKLKIRKNLYKESI